MREIRFKSFPAVEGVRPAIDTLESLRAIVRYPGQHGATAADQYTGCDVLAALQAAVDAGRGGVRLEDAQWSWLKERASSYRWVLVDPAIAEILRDVMNASVYDPNAA